MSKHFIIGVCLSFTHKQTHRSISLPIPFHLQFECIVWILQQYQHNMYRFEFCARRLTLHLCIQNEKLSNKLVNRPRKQQITHRIDEKSLIQQQRQLLQQH